jgi:VanZ family protein
MPLAKISASISRKSLSSPLHSNLWSWVAAIYVVQTFGSLVVMQLLGLRFAEVALPIVFLILGSCAAVFLRSLQFSNRFGMWKWWAPVVFYALFIFSLSNRSYPSALPTIDTKIFHPIEYLTLGVLLSVAWHNFSRNKNHFALIAFVLVSGILFAVSDEIHQAFIPGRSARITDVLIDSASIALGCALFLLTTHTMNRTRGEHLTQSHEREPNQRPPL